jgi:hypothetical protein
MTPSSFRVWILLVLVMAPVTILAIGSFAPVRAAYLTLVACPSMHPYRAGVALKYGMTEGLHRKSAPQKFSGEPVGDAPPDRYASDGWLYQIQDLFYVVDYLVCVYEDDSKVNYPLPDKALRGLGRCDFVQKWNYPDSFDGEAIRDWPYGLERKPMAICTFDFYGTRVFPPREPN